MSMSYKYLKTKHSPTFCKSITQSNRHQKFNLPFQVCINKRYQQITQDNEKLLSRLLKIAERKRSQSMPQVTFKIPKNYNKRIIQNSLKKENIKIGERLMTQNSEYDHKKMSKQIKNYQSLKKQLIKYRKHRYAGKSSLHLNIQQKTPQKINSKTQAINIITNSTQKTKQQIQMHKKQYLKHQMDTIDKQQMVQNIIIKSIQKIDDSSIKIAYAHNQTTNKIEQKHRDQDEEWTFQGNQKISDCKSSHKKSKTNSRNQEHQQKSKYIEKDLENEQFQVIL